MLAPDKLWPILFAQIGPNCYHHFIQRSRFVDGLFAMLVQTYVKRLRMRVSLLGVPRPRIPDGFHLTPWSDELADAHAEVKFRSFRRTVDTLIYPNLGDAEGCQSLMRDIRNHFGFVPEATWLIGDDSGYCGCIQGVRLAGNSGMIQNIGVLPEHRGQGLGGTLLAASLAGFHAVGSKAVVLEVSASNRTAVRLYHSFGFQTTKTVYRETREIYREYAI